MPKDLTRKTRVSLLRLSHIVDCTLWSTRLKCSSVGVVDHKVDELFELDDSVAVTVELVEERGEVATIDTDA